MNTLKTILKFAHLAIEPPFREFVKEAIDSAEKDIALYRKYEPLFTQAQAEIKPQIDEGAKLLEDAKALLASAEVTR